MCPVTYNAADFYIHCLAVAPGREARSRECIKAICDNFSVSSYAKDMAVTAHYHEAAALAHAQSRRVSAECLAMAGQGAGREFP